MIKPKVQNELALNILNDKYSLPCYFNDYQIVPMVKPFKCPLSECTHDSVNLYLNGNKIKCFSAKCKDKYLEVSK